VYSIFNHQRCRDAILRICVTKHQTYRSRSGECVNSHVIGRERIEAADPASRSGLLLGADPQPAVLDHKSRGIYLRTYGRMPHIQAYDLCRPQPGKPNFLRPIKDHPSHSLSAKLQLFGSDIGCANTSRVGNQGNRQDG